MVFVAVSYPATLKSTELSTPAFQQSAHRRKSSCGRPSVNCCSSGSSSSSFSLLVSCSRFVSPSFVPYSSLRRLSHPFAQAPWGKLPMRRAGSPGVSRSRLMTEKDEDTVTEADTGMVTEGGGTGSGNGGGGGGEDGGGGGGGAINWISSVLVYAFWAGLLLYAFTLAPNQTPSRDMYFVEKLCGLRADDGFIMNKVLKAEFFVMGLWPLIYSSLLMPTGRTKGVKVGPFAAVSFGVGAFALLPYFGLWRPPPPRVSRKELSRFPLNILESKVTAVAIIVGGLVVAGYAALAGGDDWAEFFQYLRESRFIHVMTIDFATLSALAPFWVYNDQSTRQGANKSSWLLPLSVIPYFGPALYLLLRSPLPSSAISDVDEADN